MKFAKRGPDIPDHLLWERDEGNVVFICGAGVSIPRAKLPGFLELASQLMDRFNVPRGSEARRIHEFATTNKTGGFLQIDKIFSDLEIEHDYYIIEQEVCKLLSSPVGDSSYHRIICDLAKTTTDELRLITTNFDDLFSAAYNGKEWIGPNLPNMKQEKELNGLVYLHGKCKEITSAFNTLVLSTRMFGKAYLSQGWAARFLEDVMQRYTVVFIGYSADDPPVQYLLESIDKPEESPQRMYTFQIKESPDASRRWKRRNVEPIYYEDHADLWKTLECWAERARDPRLWMKRILKMAELGPENLEDWQRSQLMHLALHPNGAKAIANYKNPISPSWLYCLDSKFRYSTPRNTGVLSENESSFDPLNQYGLLEDNVSTIKETNSMRSERRVPRNALDAFQVLPIDVSRSRDHRYLAALCNNYLESTIDLPERLNFLADWISKVAKSTIAFRWAVHQSKIHSAVRWRVVDRLSKDSDNKSLLMLNAWETLFEVNDCILSDHSLLTYNLRAQVKKHGWSSMAIQRYRRVLAPQMKIEKTTKADEIIDSLSLSDQQEDPIKCNILYPQDSDLESLEISENWTFELLQADRKNLDQAIDLEKQLGTYELWNLPKILLTNSEDAHYFALSYGKNVVVFRYIRKLEKLIGVDQVAAMAEIDTWSKDDTNVFARLRVWIAEKSDLFSDSDAGRIILDLPNAAFWNIYHWIDLLPVLVLKWINLSRTVRSKLEARIYLGDDRKVGESNLEYDCRKARLSLDMIQWLSGQGCEFEFDVKEKVKELRNACPTWEPDSIQALMASYEPNDSPVNVYFGPRGNDGFPIFESADIQSYELDDAEPTNKNVEEFRELCKHEPRSAFMKLARMSRSNIYPRWAWEFWLTLEGRTESEGRYYARTTVLLCRATSRQIFELKDSVYSWFRGASKNYTKFQFGLRNRMFENLLEVLQRYPESCASSIIRSSDKEINWIAEFLNSPPGELAESLFSRPEVRRLKGKSKLPNDWIRDAETLLSLPKDAGRYVLISFVYRLQWLHHFARKFTESRILISANSKKSKTYEAFWLALSQIAGNVSTPDLFLKLKTNLLSIVKSDASMDRSMHMGFSLLVIRGWLNREETERMISDSEFIGIVGDGTEAFRIHVLSRFRQWLSEDKGKSSIDPYEEITYFFSNIWPLSRTVHSKLICRIILRIAFFDERMFSMLVPVIVDRLGEVDILYPEIVDNLLSEDSEIMNKHPDLVLRIFSKILPSDSNQWLSGIDAIISRLELVSPDLGQDPDFLRLKSRYK